MKTLVIGSTGHIGTYLVPRLLLAGHDVICLSRGQRAPYAEQGIWKQVRVEKADRVQEDREGTFGARVASLNPDVVIDLICFSAESARQIVQEIEGRTGLYLCCGTIWVHGPSVSVPTTEAEPRRPFGEYGTGKADMESWLLSHSRETGFPAAVLHPGHIVGRGWVPLNPAGNFNLGVFESLAKGERLALPNLGLETVHHVHADDVAQAFCKAIENRATAVGESFHVVSPAALSLRGYAERIAQWFGKKAQLDFLPWEQWKATASADDAAATWDHIAHSPCISIEKARRLLGYEPRYESLPAVVESLEWLIEHGRLSV
ncbi:MAG TPA: NAD-dependent epimerase/dehydratase family protein [Spirochaetia bacterium]|nr:NAD-dependent epimerase/dehydratase family protein [Spirochaetia bacterium]